MAKRPTRQRDHSRSLTAPPVTVTAVRNYMPLLSIPFRDVPSRGPVDFREIEDHREYRPDRPVGARLLSSRPVGPLVSRKPREAPRTRFAFSGSLPPSLARKPLGRLSWPSWGLSFPQPKWTLVCLRRKARREVLHALRKTGGGGARRRRRNEWSSISCR